MENDFFQNPYPSSYEPPNNINNTQNQNQNSLIYKILPLLISGKGINEILPSIMGNNPLVSSIMSSLDKSKDSKPQKEKCLTKKSIWLGMLKLINFNNLIYIKWYGDYYERFSKLYRITLY